MKYSNHRYRQLILTALNFTDAAIKIENEIKVIEQSDVISQEEKTRSMVLLRLKMNKHLSLIKNIISKLNGW